MLSSPAAWSSQASHMIADCFDQARPYLDEVYAGLPPLVRFVAAQLSIDCHLSSESSLILIQEDKEWDADILARTIMEGSVKFAYLLYGTEEEIEEKAEEYWNVLPLFATIRHGEYARAFLETVPDPDSIEWYPFKELLVDPDEVADIRGRYSRRDRQALEEKWSFTGICRFFANTGQPGLKHLAHLAHGYTMSSHLIHKDADSIGIIWERSTREPSRRIAASFAHSARIVSDICTFATLRLFFILRACGESKGAVSIIEKRYRPLMAQISLAQSYFSSVEYPKARRNIVLGDSRHHSRFEPHTPKE